MPSTKWIILLIIGIVFSFSSCKVESLNDPIIISFVDQEFSLNLWENLQSPNDPLEIHFQTLVDENCLNTTILSSYKKIGADLELTIFEILPPENCIPGMASAKGFEPILNVINSFYTLQVELQGVVVNTGTLTIGDVFYEIEMNEENGIEWERTKLLKVPQYSLWGYITYMDDEQLTIAENFIGQLEDNTSIFSLPDGYYGHFELSNTELVSINAAPFDLDNKMFIRSYNGDPENIDALVNSFRASAPEGMELHLFGGKGQRW